MNEARPTFAVLIVAAGRGSRAGDGLPKQYRPLGDCTVLRRTIDAFLAHERLDALRVVIHPDDAALYAASAPDASRILPPVFGGESRAESVLNGLRSFDPAPSHVLIHDAARPFVGRGVIDAVLDGLADSDGAVAMIPAVDAMREVHDDGRLGMPVSRDRVHRAQTPQGFRFGAIHAALESAARAGNLSACPDEATAALAAGLRVRAVAGEPMNFKLTTPEDFTMADALLAARAPETRFGQGFDVHAFGEGDHVVLCGVAVPHSRSLSGHSDADVGLHALTDALLGAVAAGDIGRHFPPSEDEWKGADSAIFLRRAVEIVQERGFGITNVDITLMCEHPKIGPHADAMRANVAKLCGIAIGRVSVKATTTERLGFCGREEGIAALASACVTESRS